MENERFKVFETKILKTIFNPKRYEQTEIRRKFHKEELCGLYCTARLIK